MNLINAVTLFFSSLDIFKDIKNKKKKFVFFTEHKSYQKYSLPIIDTICSNFNDQVYYYSIDKNDKIKNSDVCNHYINPLLINYFFKNIKTTNMFLTLTDLGNHFQKSKLLDNRE